LSGHVPIDDLRNVGPTARAAEGRALPHAAGDELERPRRNLLAGAGHANDDRLTPAAMGAFERLAHDLHAAGAVERIVSAADLVRAALRHVDDMGNDVAFDLLRIDEMRHAETFAPVLLVIIDIDADDHVGANELEALNDVEPYAAKTKDRGARARFD